MVAYAPDADRLREGRAGRRLSPDSRRGSATSGATRTSSTQVARASAAAGPRFVFYEGPPTANGLPHNGHALTRVMKDVFPRYKSMRGFDVPRKAGWDTHGLPVEIEVEKELRISGKDAIVEYGVEPFVRRCLDSVFRYTEEWNELHGEARLLARLDDAYVTYHQSYVESVWWALSELHARACSTAATRWCGGGRRAAPCSRPPRSGEGYRTVDDPSVYVRFPLADEPGTSLLVWTTTPWTLPSNASRPCGPTSTTRWCATASSA